MEQRISRPPRRRAATAKSGGVSKDSGQTSVEKVMRQWHEARPGLDLGPLGLFAAIAHAYWLSAPRIERLMARYSLTRGMFDVLTTLRRSGPPYELAPKQLSYSLLLSGAGITNRLDRLEDLELIVRRPDPHDRRGLQIKITNAGLKLVDRVLPELIALERQMAAGLGRQDTAHLIKLLDKVSTSVQSGPDGD
jgi:DNA-binding MarR family transcriptional regulator